MPKATASRPAAVQERSRRTEKQILQAALGMLTDLGEDAITMSAVSERAGVSVGSIYRRFGSREDLLIAMSAEFAQSFSGSIIKRFGMADASGFDSVEDSIEFATTTLARTFQRKGRALGRLLVMGLSEPNIFEAGRRESIAGGEAYASLILRRRDEIARPDPEAAVEYTYRMIYAACAHRITQGAFLESQRRLSWDQMIAELTEMNIAYLITEPRRH